MDGKGSSQDAKSRGHVMVEARSQGKRVLSEVSANYFTGRKEMVHNMLPKPIGNSSDVRLTAAEGMYHVMRANEHMPPCTCDCNAEAVSFVPRNSFLSIMLSLKAKSFSPIAIW
jgi:hypothetical protein